MAHSYKSEANAIKFKRFPNRVIQILDAFVSTVLLARPCDYSLKFALEQVMKALKGSRAIALLFL
jgi:hypothetical protein